MTDLPPITAEESATMQFGCLVAAFICKTNGASDIAEHLIRIAHMHPSKFHNVAAVVTREFEADHGITAESLWRSHN